MLENKIIFNNFNDKPMYKSFQPDEYLLHLSMIRNETMVCKNTLDSAENKKLQYMLN